MGPSAMGEFYAPLWCVHHDREVTTTSRRRAHWALACAGHSSERAGEPMNTVQVEQALGMFRTYLVEYAAEQDWSEHRWGELTDAVRECFRRAGDAPTYPPPPPEQGL